MSEHVGVERTRVRARARDRRAARRSKAAAGGDSVLANMALAARFMATSALQREESRGAHARSDFPTCDPALATRTFLCLDDLDRVVAETEPPLRAAKPVAADERSRDASCASPRAWWTRRSPTALREDLGLAGDITTDATVPPEARASGIIGARKAGVVAGLQLVETAFKMLDPDADIERARCRRRARRRRRRHRARGGKRARAADGRARRNELSRAPERDRDADAPLRRRGRRARARASSIRARRRRACAPSRSSRCGPAAASTIASGSTTRSSSRTTTSSRRAASGRPWSARGRSAGHMVKIEVEVTTLAELEEALAHRPRRRAARQHAPRHAQGGGRQGRRPRRDRGLRRRQSRNGAGQSPRPGSI